MLRLAGTSALGRSNPWHSRLFDPSLAPPANRSTSEQSVEHKRYDLGIGDSRPSPSWSSRSYSAQSLPTAEHLLLC